MSILIGVTAPIGGTEILAGGAFTGIISVTGATVGMVVTVTPRTFPGTGIYWEGFVNAADSVTVKVSAPIASFVTASVYDVQVNDGSAAAGVTSVTATLPLHSSGGSTPNLTIDTATAAARGVVQPDGTTITISGAVISATQPAIGLQLIQDQLLSSAAATITFSSLGSFTHLLLIYQARSGRASGDESMYMQYNGDTAANYTTAVDFAKIADTLFTLVGEATQAHPDFVLMTGDTAPAGWAASGEIFIPNYRGTTWRKQAVGTSVGINTAFTAGVERFRGIHCWNNTAAITSILFGTQSGSNFLAGSRLSLYGYL